MPDFRDSELYQEQKALIQAEIDSYSERLMNSLRNAALNGLDFEDLGVDGFVKRDFYATARRVLFEKEVRCQSSLGRSSSVRGFLLANKDRILKMYFDGMPIHTISESLNVCQVLVKNFIDIYGNDHLVRQRHTTTGEHLERIQNMTDAERLEIAQHAVNGGNYTKTSEEYGVSRTIIRKYIRKFGLEKVKGDNHA